MSTRPVIFISAVSRELHTARDLIAKTLLALGYQPKWQDIAATDQGDLRAVLRQWIDDSDAVLQLIGHCYGFAPTSPDPHFGPCSYTQFEALYARQQGKKVYYIFTDPAHPTDGCACKPDPKPLHALQENYRKTVKSYGDLYHSTSSLDKTELLVRRMQDKLTELRAKGQKQQRSLSHRIALALGLLLMLALGGFILMRGQQHTNETVSKTERKIDQQIQVTTETQTVVTKLQDQNDKLLKALRELPQVISHQPRTDAKEDEVTRTARAYILLETQLKLPQGSLAKELPHFAHQLLQRADTSALDRASALFASQKFAEAEVEAIEAKDHALAAVGKTVQDAVVALRLAGQSAQAQIHYPQAMEHYRAAAALTSKDRDVLQWLDIQNAISWLYYLQGHYSEGLAHTKQVWQTAQQTGQSEANTVLASHINYAGALHESGQQAAAELEYRAVIKVQEHVLGSAHFETLASRNNLANVLDDQGKYTEAEQEHRAVLKVMEQVLGAEHSVVLTSRMNLANALQSQGKYAEAEQEHRAVLNIKERVLGAEHLNTLMSRNNLANALQARAKPAEAEQEQRTLIKIKERLLGAEHPDTLVSRMNLANALQSQANYAEAEQEYRAVWKLQECVLGPDHPATLATRNNLAITLHSRAKYSEAEQELRAILKAKEHVLGLEHPDTLASRMNLAITLQAQRKYAEAAQVQRAVLQLQERVLGAIHPHVALSCYNMAICLEGQQKITEALGFMQRSEQVLTKVFGSDHPYTNFAKAERGRIEASGKHFFHMFCFVLVIILAGIWMVRIQGKQAHRLVIQNSEEAIKKAQE